MIPENVTLIVKAPNQQIEDQNIECQSSWTVRQLKGHLSIVYPSKPSTDEQKIIYSGRLLEDEAVLREVLRAYEGAGAAHTVHLVCAHAHNAQIRRRNVVTPERPAEVNPPEIRQNDQNHTVEMQNYLSSIVNNYGRVPPYPHYNMGEYLPVSNDPHALHNHMMMMQQAYLQYMQNYANLWRGTEAPAAAGVGVANNTGATPTHTPPPAAPPAEEEEVRRDWLDHLYAASRLAILFSLVYLYGSPARLLLVLLLAAAGYLHHIGFFRDLQMNPQEGQGEAQNANENNEQPENDHENENADHEETDEADNVEDSDTENNVTPQHYADNQNEQSILAVTWMIFTSFFASLIPDTN